MKFTYIISILLIELFSFISLKNCMKFKANVPYMYPFCFFENLVENDKKIVKFESKVSDYQVLIVSSKGQTLYFKENESHHKTEVVSTLTG